MNTILALEVTVSELPSLNFHCDALYTSLIAVLQVTYSHLVSVSLSPTLIHTHKHRCPILAFGTTCTRIYFHHAVHRVFLLPKHVFQFEVFDGFQCLGIVLVHLFFGDHLLLIEVESQLKFVGTRLHLIISVYPFLDILHLLHLLLSPLGVIPEVRSLCAEVFLLKLNFLSVYVKITMERISAVQYIFQLFCGYH